MEISVVEARASITPHRDSPKKRKTIKKPSTATKATMMRVALPINLLNLSRLSCKGVLDLSIDPRSPASSSKAVFIQVALTIEAAIRIKINILLNCDIKSRRTETFSFSFSSFSPYFSNLFSASSELKPASHVPSISKTEFAS